MDMCSDKECSSCARDCAEQVGLPRDARLTRQNAPENGAIQDTDQQRRAQRNRRAIHQTARHEEAEPAENQRSERDSHRQDRGSVVSPI